MDRPDWAKEPAAASEAAAGAPARPDWAAEPTAGDIPGNVRAPVAAPEPKPDWFDRIRGGVEAGASVLSSLTTGAVGQVGGTLGALAGQVRQGELGDPEAGARAAETAHDAAARLTYTPPSKEGQSQLETVGRAFNKSKLAGLPMADMQLLANVGRSTGPVLRAAENTAERGAQLVDKGIEKVGAGGRTAVDLGRDVIGTRAKEAGKKAGGAAKGAVETAALDLEEAGARDLGHAEKARRAQESIARRTAAATPAEPPPSLDAQGGAIRQSFTEAMDTARTKRAEAADAEFGTVKETAAAKEAAGERVDTAPIEAILEEAITEARGITDLEGGLKRMLSAVRGEPPEPPAKPAWVPPGGTPEAPAAVTPKGKTFEQLELARRYLNDIGYSSDLEGYPAILRGQARKIAKSIDQAMQDFVPEFKVYKDHYRELSEPMESLTTRFGKAVTTTEGGLAETAYSKVANADLPARLFTRKEGVDLLVDALAGGKSAGPEARAAAQAKVEKMVEAWVLESVRQKSPTAALEHLSSPQMRSTLSSVPNIEAALKKQFGDIAGMEKTAKDMAKIGEELSGRGEKRQDAARKLRTSVTMADTMAAQPGKTSQKKAYDAYVKALQAARRDGLVPQAQYEATMGMIDRAATLEEKSAVARKIAGGIAVIGAAGATGAKYLGL